MEFIRCNWNSNHILAKNVDFFNWMYVDDEGCNYIISLDKEGNINGIEGYIKYNHDSRPDVAGTMWKVLKTDNPYLGLEIGKKMYELENVRLDAAPGLTKRAMKTNQYLGYLGGKLEHYYILGELSDYNLAIVSKVKKPIGECFDKRFIKIETEETLRKIIYDEKQREKAPYKDITYLIHRYMRHPIYKYQIIGISNATGSVGCVIVGRVVEFESSLAFKIVDILGDFSELRGTFHCFRKLIESFNFEYIDLYCYGVPEQYLLSAGFTKRIGNEVVIPNYFSPFERRNVDIYFAASVSKNLVLFRGDGDQDRPS